MTLQGKNLGKLLSSWWRSLEYSHNDWVQYLESGPFSTYHMGAVNSKQNKAVVFPT